MKYTDICAKRGMRTAQGKMPRRAAEHLLRLATDFVLNCDNELFTDMPVHPFEGPGCAAKDDCGHRSQPRNKRG